MDAVIKVGGSLQDDPIALRNLCRTLTEVSSRCSLLIVPGGGDLVNLVRKLQVKHGFSDQAAHRMAILGMDIYGFILHDLIKGSTLTDVPGRKMKGCSIFLPYKTLGRSKDLEPTWEVTSDSIAVWVAAKIGCQKLLLVKMVDGIFEQERLRRFIPIGELRQIKQPCVDPKLTPALDLAVITCWVVNGKHPDRIKRILDGGETVCTIISPGALP